MNNNFFRFLASVPHFGPHYFGFGMLNAKIREKLFIKVSLCNGTIF